MFETISHYRIIEKLGSGGMGEVYLAEDTRLGRKVAIKLLPANAETDTVAGKRLLREARAAATLDHPNICAVYEVGEDQGRRFIVMQFIDGETLAAKIRRQPMELPEALGVAVQVAEALQEAHAHGIVHRDIKPQNIMLTARGQAKVLDFGLAKVAAETVVADSQAETVSVLTTTGEIMGTVPYMSPEQVKGENLDSRSDIFSLGTMIYELVSGRHPFSASSTAEIFSAILTREPPPLQRDRAGAPLELERIVARCLEKDRERRYQSAGEVVAALRDLERKADRGRPAAKELSDPIRRHLRSPIVAVVILLLLVTGGIYWFFASRNSIESIAVLPLDYTGADPETESFADGITDNIIDRLHDLPDLRVMAHRTVFHYKGRQGDPRAIGRELDVEAVVTGRLVQHNDTLTLRMELIDVKDGRPIWRSESYTRKRSELPTLPGDISLEIADHLSLRLSAEAKQRLAKNDTENLEAYRLYEKGRSSLERWDREGANEAVGWFEEAIKKDDNYALAWSGLADALMFGATGLQESKEIRDKAKKAAERALQLDPMLGEAHGAWGQILMEDWNFSGAEKAFKEAIRLSPSYAGGRHQYSHFLLTLGRIQESLTESETYLKLDPVSSSPIGHLGYHYLYAREYDKAIEYSQKAIGLGDEDARGTLAEAFYMRERFPEAIEEYLKVRIKDGATADEIAGLKEAFARSGKNGFLRQRIVDLMKAGQQKPMLALARHHARLNEVDEAFDWLEKAYAERLVGLIRLKEELAFDNLRTDERYANLLRRVGLPQ